jgi:hypothetical protein
MDESVKTQLSDSVRKLSMLSRQVAGVGATDLTPRERGDLIGELQSLAETFDTLAAHATGDDMLETAREGRARVAAALAELELVPPHKSNRKITLPWPADSLYPVPNIQNHGTRNLGIILSGGAELRDDPEGGLGKIAVLADRTIGRVDFTREAERALLDVVSPRTIKTMVATARLIWEKTNHQAIPNQAATLSIGEIARAMGYTAGKDRAIDPLITQRIASDVFLLNRVVTWAADGPYERQKRKRQSGWIAPLIVITAVHVEQETFDGPALPYEFDAMLGRNWAAALANTDILQVAPGFIELDEESAIRLAWYYLTEFRYRMTRPEPGPTLNIAALCEAARIDAGLAKNRARFLERLERWHALLQSVGVIGTYERVPPADVDESPGQLFTEANYRVEPPKPILEAYQRSRQYAINRRQRRPKVRG